MFGAAPPPRRHVRVPPGRSPSQSKHCISGVLSTELLRALVRNKSPLRSREDDECQSAFGESAMSGRRKRKAKRADRRVSTSRGSCTVLLVSHVFPTLSTYCRQSLQEILKAQSWRTDSVARKIEGGGAARSRRGSVSDHHRRTWHLLRSLTVWIIISSLPISPVAAALLTSRT